MKSKRDVEKSKKSKKSKTAKSDQAMQTLPMNDANAVIDRMDTVIDPTTLKGVGSRTLRVDGHLYVIKGALAFTVYQLYYEI